MRIPPVRRGTIAGLIALFALHGTLAGAQHGTLRAYVYDSTGRGIAGAELTIAAQARRIRTDSTGRAVFESLPLGTVELSVRRLGFGAEQRVALVSGAATDSVMIMLKAQTTSLEQVDVNALGMHPFFKGFEQRRAQGIGTFITRDQIEAQNTSTPSDLFRMVPQVKLVRVSGGLGIRFPSGMTSIRSGPGNMCQPMMWLDGQRAPGVEIDDLRKDDIQAIELYRGASVTPPQFASAGVTQCGAVVVWTRRKG
jgi:hypothetical protein